MLTTSTPFAVASRRAQTLLSDIEQKINSGEITTRSALLSEIITRVSDFTQTLREPSMTVPRMVLDDILIRENVSVPVDQASEDVLAASEQVELTRNLSKQVFNVCQAEREGLKELLAEVTALMDSLRLWISDSDPTFMWVGDTFNDRSKADPSSTVFVDTAAGTTVLQPDESQSLSSKVTAITIDKQLSEGGIPGNNSEVREPGKEAFTGDRKEPRPRLFREQQSDRLVNVLDGNPDTWFEWERVYSIFPQPTIVAGNAHVYDPAGRPHNQPQKLLNWNCFIRWPGEEKLDQGDTITTKQTKKTGFLKLFKKKIQRIDKVGYPLAYFKESDRKLLRLGLSIELDQPRPISWLQLSPYLREGAYPEIEQVLVSVDGDQWRPLLETPIVLNPRINRGVDFSQLAGAASNFEGVGVIPFPRTAIRYVKIILRQTASYRMPLGLGHQFFMDKKGKKRVQANALVVGDNAASLQAANEVDFAQSESATEIAVSELFDVLQGERQMIGIRDLTLEERTYQAQGQFVSLPYQLPQPAKAVALLVTEHIPEDWARTNPDGRPWIFYEVSTDGQSWQPIVPQVAQLEDSVVRFDTAVTTLYFRATFSRPDDRPTESPVLYSYALKVLP